MILLVLWVVLWIGAGELQQVFVEVGDLRILPLGVLCKGLRHRVVRHQRAFLAAQQVKKFGGILYAKRRVFYPNRVDVARQIRTPPVGWPTKMMFTVGVFLKSVAAIVAEEKVRPPIKI